MPRRRDADAVLKSRFRKVSFFECDPEDSPFSEPLGKRSWLVTFASRLRTTGPEDGGLRRDLEFLGGQDWGWCRYGAADARILPFLCEFEVDGSGGQPTGADVLAGLNLFRFSSEHIRDLKRTYIPFPGYHPYSANDEIHNDFAEQHLFAKEQGEGHGVHGSLKRYVGDAGLWYVLAHPRKHDGMTPFVYLFAVGRSPHGNRLAGVISHQACHNLCD